MTRQPTTGGPAKHAYGNKYQSALHALSCDSRYELCAKVLSHAWRCHK